MLRKLIFILLFSPTLSWAQEDTTTNLGYTKISIDSTIFVTEYITHGAYKDMTPGMYVDSIPFNIDNIKGGWERVVSSAYYTPNGDAMWEPNEVHGSIYFSANKIYYMNYPLRMHSYANYRIDEQEHLILFNQKILPDSLDWFTEEPDLFTKDSLTILYFDGQYYRRQEMDIDIVLELELKTIRPKVLIGDWAKTDTLWCCYGTMWWQEYPWKMPENIHISRTWANKIYNKQMIYFEIDGIYRPFFIAVLDEYQIELEAGDWFNGKADRVVYQRR